MTPAPATQMDRTHERTSSTSWSWRKLLAFGKDDTPPATIASQDEDTSRLPGLARRLSRKVVPGLPRPGTFKRQQSELRDRLEPTKPNPEERRTVSVDRRLAGSVRSNSIKGYPRVSAPELLEKQQQTIVGVLDQQPAIPPASNTKNSNKSNAEWSEPQDYAALSKEPSNFGTASVSTEGLDEMMMEELEKKWILNLSMHFRDKSRREKFFVTFAETPTHWRRVTISLDYRNAPQGSLEEELQRTRFQRDKSARIYEAIRESLPDIQFYDTVTNLKLQTENERLHVHVVEDRAEIISYPPVRAIGHLKCRRIREDELVFDSHLSGFVYKVRVNGEIFIKKEIPGPDTVDEFLYEINALHQLSGSRSVIQFGGVVLDNKGETVKGLLISFAEQGALIDVIYDGVGKISWKRRERWAKQVVQGLSEIHEAGFVQGDFTLSNIVIDGDDNAKIIDINRRGCPVGWEPPEVAALIESNQRISMYIGVKSDLFQLGMVLYALATQEDEPETQRPLDLDSFPAEVPEYYLELCQRCLNDDPRKRSQAQVCLTLFPPIEEVVRPYEQPIPIVVDARHVDEDMFHYDSGFSRGHEEDLRKLSSVYSPGSGPPRYAETDVTDDSEYFPRRGRSPPPPPPPPPFRKETLPTSIPLPDSSHGSDHLNNPSFDFQIITPMASKDRMQEGELDQKEEIHIVPGGDLPSPDENDATPLASKKDPILAGDLPPAGDRDTTPLAARNEAPCIIGNHEENIPPPDVLPGPRTVPDGTQHISGIEEQEIQPTTVTQDPAPTQEGVPARFPTELIGIGHNHGSCLEKLPTDLDFDDDTIPRQTCS